MHGRPWRFRCQEIGCAVGVTSVGVGLRNRAAFVVELLAIRHPVTLVLVFLDERAICSGESYVSGASCCSHEERWTPPASSAPSPAMSTPQLDPTAIVTLLRSLELSEDLLTQVRAAFPRPPAQSQKKRAAVASGAWAGWFGQSSCGSVGEVCCSSSFAVANVCCEPRSEVGRGYKIGE